MSDKQKKFAITNPSTKEMVVRAYGGLEGIAPKRTRVCVLKNEDAAKAAEKSGLKIKEAKADADLGYVDDVEKAPEAPKATDKKTEAK